MAGSEAERKARENGGRLLPRCVLGMLEERQAGSDWAVRDETREGGRGARRDDDRRRELRATEAQRRAMGGVVEGKMR
jgi:hypothetical protein